MKPHASIFLLIFTILISSAAAAAAPAASKTIAQGAKPTLPSADSVIKNIRAKEASLNSYSYNVHRFDLADKFVLKRNEEGLQAYKAILDKLSFLTRQKNDVSKGDKGYKESISTMQFIKPYTFQYLMEKSEFVPSFLQRSKVIYRPETNDAELFLKEPFLGMLLSKEVTNESGTAMIQNWAYELMELDCAIANGGKASVLATADYDAYLLDISLKKGKIPWAVGCGGKRNDVPVKAYDQLNRELKQMADRIDFFKNEKGYIRFWIDPASWLIVGKEVMFGKTAAIRYTLSDIKLNSVKPEDLIEVKPRK